MRLALARLELLSYGKTMSLSANSSPTCEEPGGSCPQGSLKFGENPPHLVFAARYANCVTDPERFDVLTHAREVYKDLTTRKYVIVHEETQKEWCERVLAAHGWPPRDVANALRCSATEVRRLRTENQCDPETGEPLVLDARLLRSRGVSWKEIGRLMGCSAGAVRYQLRDR